MRSGAEAPAGFRPVETASGFGALIGPIHELHEDGAIVLGFHVAEKHLNRVKIVHGGMLTAFADMTMGAVLRVNGLAGVTVRMTQDLMAPCHLDDWVEGRAAASRITKTMVFVECEVRANGRLALTASGVFRCLRRRRR